MSTTNHTTDAPAAPAIEGRPTGGSAKAAQPASVDHGHASTETDFAKAQGHWILARMGKKVLRPGGIDLTRRMLEALAVNAGHDVAEFAPGIGHTAAITLANGPHSYTGIDADTAVVADLTKRLGASGRRFIHGNAAATGLHGACMDRVYGEAMLTMHADHRKREIIREAFRILRPGGMYGIHELGLTPDGLSADLKALIQRDLAQAIRVNARPLTGTEWRSLLESEGFTVHRVETNPMLLMETGRVLADEGLMRTLKITFNVLRHPVARRRLMEMRRVFRTHQQHMNAIALVAVRP